MVPHAMASSSRGRATRSTSAPAGPASTAPTMDPAASTVPTFSGVHPAAPASHVDRNAPNPPPTSAMKKLTAGSAKLGFMGTGNGKACGRFQGMTQVAQSCLC